MYLLTNMGKILRGILSKLNNVRDTKAVFASKILFSSINTYVVKLARATRKGADVHKNDVNAFIYAALIKAAASCFRISVT